MVIDLQLVPSEVPFPTGPQVEVRALPTPDSFVHVPGPVFNRPRTLAALTTTTFVATSLNPAGSDYADGYLRLDDPTRFAPVHIDPEGSAFKVLRFADNLRRQEQYATDESPDAFNVPALRAHGLSVARLERAEQVHVQHFAGLAPNDANSPRRSVTRAPTRSWRPTSSSAAIGSMSSTPPTVAGAP